MIKTGKVVTKFLYQSKLVCYFSQQNQIKIAFLDKTKKWQILKKPVFKLPEEYRIKIVGLKLTPKTIKLEIKITHSTTILATLAFDRKKPTKTLGKKTKELKTKKPTPLEIKKFKYNPILKPIVGHLWESKAVFNPAAVYEDNKVHLVYRAVGEGDVSVLGYACSENGIQISKRLKEPIFIPQHTTSKKASPTNFNLSPFMSGGGGYGGCEDPRLTKIDGKFYMTYVAYDGWSPPRVALTSIKVEDFLNHDWNWNQPVLISKPGVIDKNACILPEKVKDKYVIFHRVFPNILIDFVDSLDFDGQTWLQGEYKIEPREGCWDSRKVGIGPTPMKTKDGWLAIYHAVDDKDDSKYQIGAMLLDFEDPTKVLYRTNQPILKPTECYENEGLKHGVVYPCGSTIVKNQLLVYYGGADMVTCVATAPINEFLNKLKNSESAHLETINLINNHDLN